MAAPNSDREVLTRIKKQDGSEGWEIDTYNHSQERFNRAFAWDHEVLFWREIPPCAPKRFYENPDKDQI